MPEGLYAAEKDTAGNDEAVSGRAKRETFGSDTMGDNDDYDTGDQSPGIEYHDDDDSERY